MFEIFCLLVPFLGTVTFSTIDKGPRSTNLLFVQRHRSTNFTLVQNQYVQNLSDSRQTFVLFGHCAKFLYFMVVVP
jgi:hypothetical protein